MRLKVIINLASVFTGYDFHGNPTFQSMAGAIDLQPVVMLDPAPTVCRLKEEGFYHLEVVYLQEFQRLHASYNNYGDEQ